MERTELLEKVQSKVIGVRDYRKIVKFVNKAELKQPILDMLFGAKVAQVNGIDTWLSLRLKADLSAKDMKELQLHYGEDVTTAVVEKFPHLLEENPLESRDETGAEKIKNIIELVLEVLIDDEKYELFIDMLSSVYDVPKDAVETLSIEDITMLTQDLTSSSAFIPS